MKHGKKQRGTKKHGKKQRGTKKLKKPLRKRSNLMARKRIIKKHAEEHPRGTLLEFDDASDDIKNLLGATVVVAWVIFQAQPGGIFAKSSDFTPVTGKWSAVRGSLSIANPRPGVYS